MQFIFDSQHVVRFSFGFLALTCLACGQTNWSNNNNSSAFNSPAIYDGTADPGLIDSSAPQTGQSKVFLKNPIFAAKKNIGYLFNNNPFTQTVSVYPTEGIDYDAELMPVTLTNIRAGYLQNPDIIVRTDYLDGSGFHKSTSARAQADSNGNWFFPSLDDPDHKLGQAMAYYWINQEIKTVNNVIPGMWHATNKKIDVYSHCYDANGAFGSSSMGINAFWAGVQSNFVCMSYAGKFESSFDASVYTHEMGHADIDYGTNGQISAGQTSVPCRFDGTNSCCPSNLGCADAINEGQADMHAFIVFNSGVMGEFFVNSLKGLDGRDAELNSTITAQTVFSGTALQSGSGTSYGDYGQEIHSMGGVWAASWWTLRQSIGATDADKLFFSHLSLLTGSDTFTSALSAVLTADQVLSKNGTYATDHRSLILAAFAQHGISPN